MGLIYIRGGWEWRPNQVRHVTITCLHLNQSVIITYSFVLRNDHLYQIREIKFVAAVSTSDLPNEAVFFFLAQLPIALATFQTIAERAAKRERGHAPHASNGEQARRIRHSNSLLAPKARPRTAARSPLYVNSTQRATRPP